MVAKEQLIIPVYLNEKIVLDMLAIIEDGFSKVSEITTGANFSANGDANLASSGSTNPIFEQLFKIQLGANLSGNVHSTKNSEAKYEKVHTSVSLFSKLRTSLLKYKFLFDYSNDKFDFTKLKTGDFVELEGELQKNPLIDVLEKFTKLLNISDLFATQDLNTATSKQHKKSLSKSSVESIPKVYAKQIKSFSDEISNSGTIDYILSGNSGKLVLSLQQQYLIGNENISEIIGGRFKVLGKVIKICTSETESIDLLRKTSLSTMNAAILQNFAEAFKSEEFLQFNLPDVVFEIKGPSAIVIPIAIYI